MSQDHALTPGATNGSQTAHAQQEESAHGSFNLSSWTLEHRPFVLFMLVLIFVFGVASYGKLARSEDPPFTFKTMVIKTFWPGATASQVQQEVTDRIERKLQESPDLDYLKSYSRPGESTIFFNIKDSVDASKVPDGWYQVRKKVGDIKQDLPRDIQGPFFNDEFGDVYTNVYAFEGDGFTPAQLHDYAERLRAELLRVPNVAKVDYFGDPEQRVRVEISNAQLAKLGLSPQQIAQTLNEQNSSAGAGVFTTANDQVYVRASGQYADTQAVANTLLRVNGRTIRLGDIAQISRGYVDPLSDSMRFQGQNVLGIGVSMAPSGNVIELGKALKAKTAQLQASLPAGLKLVEVSSMPNAVAHSVADFVEAVAEAILIVLIVSLASLGVRTGMVVVISIPLVLATTALCMHIFGIGLHKVSLGTLILALGLLVDDAIIAVEMMAVKLEQGFARAKAAAFAYTSTAFPMLTGTLVTVSGFLPIALAKSMTGEYTRSIFQVSAISLLVSWLAAVIVIPLLGYWILSEHPHAKHGQPHPGPNKGHAAAPAAHGETDVYNTPLYGRLRRWIGWCVDHRLWVLGGTAVAFVVGLAGFGMVPKQFFPASERPELLVDLRLQEGASYAATLREAKRLETALAGLPGIDHTIDFVGAGAPRFYLSLDQQLANSNFAQFVITTKGVKEREQLVHDLDETLRTQFAADRTRITRLENGPPVGFPVQFRVSGPEIAGARGIAEQVANVTRANPNTVHTQLDWDEPGERSVHFEVDQNKARQLGVSSEDIENYLQMTLSGIPMTELRERDKLIAVELRAPKGDRLDPSQIERFAVPTASGTAIPLASLGRFKYGLEDAVIWERDRQPTVTVQADVVQGAQPIDVTQQIDKSLASIRAHLPPGYRIQIGGAVEESAKGQNSIVAQVVFAIVAVLVLLMIQLQSFSRMLMVVLTAPLGLIGVVGALLALHMPFGFVAMLGTLAMFGIIMRNSVILVHQIDED
ncbi:MAG TPA: efflux RND transporter permease subunit, partial [Burkholderiaceae bacterium]|nr:efflux RND transporter permease subunit [Burkholderiaceae bacterium]